MRTATELERFLDLPAWVVDTDGKHWRRADWLDQTVSDATDALSLWDDNVSQLVEELGDVITNASGDIRKSVKGDDIREIIERYQS